MWPEVKTLFEAFIDSISGRGIRPGLSRMREAIKISQLPGPEVKVIVVGGTNGKGSTAKKIESALRATGVRTYLYTSPHLIGFEERFRFNGKSIESADLEKAHEACLSRFPKGETQAGLLTPFEWMTIVGGEAAMKADSEVWILEVGLGGRLDAVNAFTPDISVITSIGLDHCEQLGKDLESIAREKMGILRSGKPALIGSGAQPWVEAEGAYYEGQDFGCSSNSYQSLDHTTFKIQNTGHPSSSALALAVTEIMMGESALAKASKSIMEAQWPARLDVFRETPLGIMDGAHNPSAAKWLCEQIQTRWPDQKFEVVLGVRADKDVEGMVRALHPLANKFVAVRDSEQHLSPSSQLAERIQKHTDVRVECSDALVAGLVESRAEPILITGSLYLCGELLRDLGMQGRVKSLN